MKKPSSQPQEGKVYEEMMSEVGEIVRQLNENEVGLDELVKKVERGYTLIRSMQERLDQAKMQVEELKGQFSGGGIP
jgi:exodeoxyribonuclease VII small subunit